MHPSREPKQTEQSRRHFTPGAKAQILPSSSGRQGSGQPAVRRAGSSPACLLLADAAGERAAVALSVQTAGVRASIGRFFAGTIGKIKRGSSESRAVGTRDAGSQLVVTPARHALVPVGVLNRSVGGAPEHLGMVSGRLETAPIRDARLAPPAGATAPAAKGSSFSDQCASVTAPVG